MTISRRAALGGLATAGVAGVAACSGASGPADANPAPLADQEASGPPLAAC